MASSCATFLRADSFASFRTLISRMVILSKSSPHETGTAGWESIFTFLPRRQSGRLLYSHDKQPWKPQQHHAVSLFRIGLGQQGLIACKIIFLLLVGERLKKWPQARSLDPF